MDIVYGRKLGIVATALFLSASVQPALAKKTTVTFMTAGFVAQKGWETVKAAFEKRNPEITVKLIPGGGDAARLVTLMAGGVGPDLGIFDQSISTYALRNLILPLDSYLKADGLTQDKFWAPTWKEGMWNGKVYALGWMSHANFACLFNGRMFKEAGLNPKAPQTVDELSLVSQKLSVKDDKGKLKTGALLPWGTYGYANSVYTWGWIFGGEFYDPTTKKVTCNDPHIVEALKWMGEYAQKFGGLSAFSALSGGKAVNGSGIAPFFNQRVAMAYSHPGEAVFISQFAKSGLDIQYGKMPVAGGVKDDPAWIGGWKMGMIPSSKNRAAAWKLLKFMTADPEGTAILCGLTGEFPAYKLSNLYDTYKKDPVHKAFMDVLTDASHIRPVIPTSDLLAGQLDSALNAVLSGKKSPVDALNLAQSTTQKELQRYLTRYKF